MADESPHPRGLSAVLFVALVATALALAPTLAHLLELRNKMDLPRDAYLTVQGIYRGWAWLGAVVLVALVSTGSLAAMCRGRPGLSVPALIAFLCIAGTQVIFWSFTYPANRLTANWTVLPDDWIALRRQWEYSHAASAVLNLIAMVAVALVATKRGQRQARVRRTNILRNLLTP